MVKKTLINLLLLFSLILHLAPAPVVAVEPDEVLSDPKLEQRARNLSKEFRCLVCQNQSIDDSDASLAKDLRVLIRERLVKGDDDTQVIDYVVGRYGEFVLLKPSFKPHNYVLWIGPFLLLLLGIISVTLLVRRNRQAVQEAAAKPLSKKEQAQLDKLLK